MALLWLAIFHYFSLERTLGLTIVLEFFFFNFYRNWSGFWFFLYFYFCNSSDLKLQTFITFIFQLYASPLAFFKRMTSWLGAFGRLLQFPIDLSMFLSYPESSFPTCRSSASRFRAFNSDNFCSNVRSFQANESLGSTLGTELGWK